MLGRGLPSRLLLQAGRRSRYGRCKQVAVTVRTCGCRAASASAVIGHLSVLIGVKGQSGLLALASRQLNRSTWSQEPEVASAADRVTSAAGAKLTIDTT